MGSHGTGVHAAAPRGVSVVTFTWPLDSLETRPPVDALSASLPRMLTARPPFVAGPPAARLNFETVRLGVRFLPRRHSSASAVHKSHAWIS